MCDNRGLFSKQHTSVDANFVLGLTM